MLHTIRNIIQNHSHLLLLYFFYALCIVYVLALICFKIHSPFWFHQPVYHSYEIYPRIRFSKEPYVKNKRPPREGIFCDTKHIVTSTVSDITTGSLHGWQFYIESYISAYDTKTFIWRVIYIMLLGRSVSGNA